MRKVLVLVNKIPAGVLEEIGSGKYQFTYHSDYQNLPPVSLTMPIVKKNFIYEKFPPFFEGLLPEGIMLEALLKKCKLDREDYLGQLIKVGHDVVGAVTIEEIR